MKHTKIQQVTGHRWFNQKVLLSWSKQSAFLAVSSCTSWTTVVFRLKIHYLGYAICFRAI